MNHKKWFQWIWLGLIVIAVTLSCSLVSNVLNNPIEEVGGDIATEIESMGTEMNDIATEVEAMITDVEEEGVVDTLEAAITEMPDLTGEKPEDIPVIEENNFDLVASSDFITYFVEKSLQEAIDFYEREMPINGWTKVDADSRVESDFAELVYEKDGRRAKVTIETIPFIDQTTITIEITG